MPDLPRCASSAWPAMLGLLGLLAAGMPAAAGSAEGRDVGIVSHVKVLSDRVEDVSSLDAWKRSALKEGMTDEQKALAVWNTVVRFRHQDDPPNEFLNSEDNVHDAIKTFNVYGYGMCCCASANIEQLARYAGLKARGWAINLHSVPEVFWDGGWRLLDASLISYFPKADGKLASVEEIITGVKAWHEANAGYKGDGGKLAGFMAQGGWRKGPDILSRCPTYGDDGLLPAGVHGWHATMQEYDGSTCFPYEYAYSEGYQVNVQLRPGERLTRNWSNKGLHLNQAEGHACGSVQAVPGQGDLRYSPKYGDLAPGRVGNGTVEYDVPLAGGASRTNPLAASNVAWQADDG